MRRVDAPTHRCPQPENTSNPNSETGRGLTVTGHWSGAASAAMAPQLFQAARSVQSVKNIRMLVQRVETPGQPHALVDHAVKRPCVPTERCFGRPHASKTLCCIIPRNSGLLCLASTVASLTLSQLGSWSGSAHSFFFPPFFPLGMSSAHALTSRRNRQTPASVARVS